MTDTPEHPVVRLTPVDPRWPAPDHPAIQGVQAGDQPQPLSQIVADNADRIDANFERIDKAIAEIRTLATIKAKRPRRTGAAARRDPDTIGFANAIVVVNAVFLIGALSAAIHGQYALAPHTPLPYWLWWAVPAAIELPIVASAFTAAIYRRRKQNTEAARNWAVVWVLTFVSLAVNVFSALEAAEWFDGAILDVPDWAAVGIMGLMPLLVLFTSHNLSTLLVRPTGERPEVKAEPEPAQPARVTRTTTSKKASTKK